MELLNKIVCLLIIIYSLIIPVSAEWLNLTPTMDTLVTNSSNTSNYGAYDYLSVGYNINVYDTYYYYDISSLPSNVVINSATVNNYLDYMWADAPDVYLITSSWNEFGVTWNTKPSYGEHIFTANNSTLGYVSNDVTNLVQSYYNNSIENYGLVYKINTFNISSLYLYSSKEAVSPRGLPYLNISYTLLPGSVVTGTVSYLANGQQVPISGAEVRIWNNLSTYSSSTTTTANGLYTFSGLSNNETYYLQGKKYPEYVDGAIEIITVGENTTATKNILLSQYISPYVPNFVFQKIIIRSIFDKPYPGVTVNVFKSNNLNAEHTGTTDSMGQIVFQLIKDQYYRIELSGGGLPNTLTNYFYAKEEAYLVSIATGYPTTGDMLDDIIFLLETSTFNATYNNLSLVYEDTRSSTTAINFYARNLTNNATCTQTSTSQSVTLNCTVLASGSYRFGFNSTSTIYGLIQKDKIIDFNAGNVNAPKIIGDKIDADVLNWVSILLIIFIGGFFSIISVKIGAVLVPLASLFLWWMGALNVSIVFITMAIIIGVMVYMRKSEVKVSY